MQSFDSKFAIFRGVTDASYPLLPGISRLKLREDFTLKSVEALMLGTFRQRAVPYLSHHTSRKMSGNGWRLPNIMGYRLGSLIGPETHWSRPSLLYERRLAETAQYM